MNRLLEITEEVQVRFALCRALKAQSHSPLVHRWHTYVNAQGCALTERESGAFSAGFPWSSTLVHVDVTQQCNISPRISVGIEQMRERTAFVSARSSGPCRVYKRCWMETGTFEGRGREQYAPKKSCSPSVAHPTSRRRAPRVRQQSCSSSSSTLISESSLMH